MQTNTVASTEMKPTSTGGVQTIVHFTDGSKSSGFEPGLQSLKAGDVFQWEPEVKGKYINIKPGAWEVTGHTEVTPVSKPEPKSDMSKDEWAEKDRRTRLSIERQTCLKAAVDFLVAGTADSKFCLKVAEEFYDWVSIGKLPDTPKTDTKQAPLIPQDEGLDSPPPKDATSKPVAQKKASSGEPPTTLKELKALAHSRFGILNINAFLEAAEVEKVENIKDFGATWETIKKNREIKPTPQEE